MKLFKHRGVQIICLITLYLFIAPFCASWVHQGLYTLSLLIKDLLLWMLPITVGLFIAHAVASFEKRAPLFVLVLFLFEGVSNTLSVWYAYSCAQFVQGQLPLGASVLIDDAFQPLWRLAFSKPIWWSADKGAMAGIVLGMLSSFVMPALKNGLGRGKQVAEWVLTRIFSRLIPIFLLGFVARMVQTRLFDQIISHYADLCLWLTLFLTVYIIFLFVLGSGRAFVQSIKNMLPATGMSLSSGCSLSTMPWTIEGASKNLRDPDLAKAVIPATTNIQQVGDCVANCFLCFLIYCQFYGHAPGLAVWLPFSVTFVLARYATAAILGGAIFIMLPIYESYMHFTPEMTAMILAFNVILDPLITSANVTANGALCRIFERVWDRVRGDRQISSKELVHTRSTSMAP